MTARNSAQTRELLGFALAVQREFAFLQQFGFHCVVAELTRVRYESSDRYVNVFHGRYSYEIGVEIGLAADTKEAAECWVSLLEAAPHVGLEDQERRLRATTAKTSGSLNRIVGELALILRRAPSLLTGDASAFVPILAARSEATDKFVEGQRAGLLRARADQAWRDEEWDRATMAYEEIRAELPTQSLRPSELRRLEVAARRANITRSDD